MFSSAKSHDVKGATIRGDGRSTTSPQRSYHLAGAESYSGQNTEVKKFFYIFFARFRRGSAWFGIKMLGLLTFQSVHSGRRASRHGLISCANQAVQPVFRSDKAHHDL